MPTLHAIDEFFDLVLVDHFDVELDAGISVPLAKVLLRLFEETKRGNLEGVKIVLKEELEEEEEEERKKQEKKIIQEEEKIIQQNQQQQEEEEEDGWKTVPIKKGKKKGGFLQ